jgi:hypothetical protein
MSLRVAALVFAVLLTASLAEAGDLRKGSIVPRVGPIVPHGPNIVPNPPPERLRHHGHPQKHGRQHGHGHGRHHGVGPGFVFVTPPAFYAVSRECLSPGYWAYQWVPTSYTESVWVPGGWAPDGMWLEGRYEQRAYASGYYHPYWVPGQTYAC